MFIKVHKLNLETEEFEESLVNTATIIEVNFGVVHPPESVRSSLSEKILKLMADGVTFIIFKKGNHVAIRESIAEIHEMVRNK